MSVKIKISYIEDGELTAVLGLLQPILPAFKVKKSMGTPPYKTAYLSPKKPEKPDK